jgi:hypothetical protein
MVTVGRQPDGPFRAGLAHGQETRLNCFVVTVRSSCAGSDGLPIAERAWVGAPDSMRWRSAAKSAFSSRAPRTPAQRRFGVPDASPAYAARAIKQPSAAGRGMNVGWMPGCLGDPRLLPACDHLLIRVRSRHVAFRAAARAPQDTLATDPDWQEANIPLRDRLTTSPAPRRKAQREAVKNLPTS